MTEELQRKVDRAVKLIQAAGKIAKEHGQPLEICYSGGKDSDVILELARMSGADIEIENEAGDVCKYNGLKQYEFFSAGRQFTGQIAKRYLKGYIEAVEKYGKE